MNNVLFLGYECIVTFGKYRENDRVAIQLMDIEDGGLVATASVNLVNEPLKENEVAIKNYGENEGMLIALVKAGIVSSPKRFTKSGYVSIPICELLVEPKF